MHFRPPGECPTPLVLAPPWNHQHPGSKLYSLYYIHSVSWVDLIRTKDLGCHFCTMLHHQAHHDSDRQALVQGVLEQYVILEIDISRSKSYIRTFEANLLAFQLWCGKLVASGQFRRDLAGNAFLPSSRRHADEILWKTPIYSCWPI
jgi:hypothetical protein